MKRKPKMNSEDRAKTALLIAWGILCVVSIFTGYVKTSKSQPPSEPLRLLIDFQRILTIALATKMLAKEKSLLNWFCLAISIFVVLGPIVIFSTVDH